MDSYIKNDTYRLYGKYHHNILSDYRLLYLFCWRKITNGSKFNTIYKIVLMNLRKHYHIEIPYSVKIDQGFSMDHAYNITINSSAIIGKNVTMYKGSTIGCARSGVPVVGNNVYIGLNSTIVGGCIIGNDVLIAPNAYVNFDVPDHSIVIGNPGEIHHKMDATKGYLLNIIDLD